MCVFVFQLQEIFARLFYFLPLTMIVGGDSNVTCKLTKLKYMPEFLERNYSRTARNFHSVGFT